MEIKWPKVVLYPIKIILGRFRERLSSRDASNKLEEDEEEEEEGEAHAEAVMSLLQVQYQHSRGRQYSGFVFPLAIKLRYPSTDIAKMEAVMV